MDSKYLNETTATEKDLIKAGLTACEKCMKNIKMFLEVKNMLYYHSEIKK